MRPCISEATTLTSSFADDVNGYADGGCRAMEVWLTKLETHLETHSAADTRKLLDDRGLTPAAASYQGGLLWSFAARRRSAPAWRRPFGSSARPTSRTSASISTCSITTPVRASSRICRC